jgi:1,4-dihydroxy-2-naphthoyl-CoA hydrolase
MGTMAAEPTSPEPANPEPANSESAGAEAAERTELTATFRGLMPFTATLGITVVRYEPAEVRARLPWSGALCTVGGALHGGALMALADSAGGACAYLNLPAGAQGTTTIESKTNFLRAVRAGFAEAVARPLHKGRTLIVVETDVTDDRGRLVARVTQSQLVLGGK